MSDTAGLQPYEQSPKPRKSRKVFWIVGGLILVAVGLGTCIKGGIGLFEVVADRNEATESLVRVWLSDGLPDAADPIYAQRGNISQDMIENASRYIRQYGEVSEFSAAGCNVRKAANIDSSQSGTFADCGMTVVSEHSPGVVQVQWVKEDETWKVLGFNVAYSDQSVLLDKAERADEMRTEEAPEAAAPELDAATED